MDDPHGMPGYTVRDRRWWAREEEEEPSGAGERPSYVAQLEAELADRDRRLVDALARQRQAIEEQELARQRVEREARREIARSRKELLASLLPVLDDLDRAIAAADDRAADVAALRRGVELVQSGFLDRLRALGVERDVPVPGDAFDPAHHEAVSVMRGEVDGSIGATVSPGYRLGDEVLRPARVVVTRADREAWKEYPGSR
jgi:molecular chaperone GrpE